MKKQGNKAITIGIAAALAVVLILLSLINSGLFKSEPTVEVVAENKYEKTLHVVTDEDYRPYSFYGENGTYSGHDVELIALVANKLHMNLDLWLLPWDEAIDAVTEGKADLLMTCDYSDSFGGSKKLLKTEPVSDDDFIVYATKAIGSVDELYGKHIAIVKNANVLTQLEMMNLAKNCVEYSSNRKALQAVLDGDADCAVMRNTIGNTLLQDSELSGLTGYLSIGKSYMCFGVDATQEELAHQINETIEELKAEGAIAELSEKWLSTFVEQQTLAETLAENRWIVALFVILLAVLALQFILEHRRTKESEAEKNLYIDVIEKISGDFESVLFVGNFDTHPDDVVELRLSETLKRNIPGWQDEKRMEGRFGLMCEHIVAPDDRKRFTALTSRRSIARKLDSGKVHFVTFDAIIDEKPRTYQIKFIAGASESDAVTSCIIGVHEIGENPEEEQESQLKVKEGV